MFYSFHIKVFSLYLIYKTFFFCHNLLCFLLTLFSYFRFPYFRTQQLPNHVSIIHINCIYVLLDSLTVRYSRFFCVCKPPPFTVPYLLKISRARAHTWPSISLLRATTLKPPTVPDPKTLFYFCFFFYFLYISKSTFNFLPGSQYVF